MSILRNHVVRVGVCFPDQPDVLPPLGDRIDLRMIGWVDPPEIRQAKSAGIRTARWLRAREQPLSDPQRAELAEAEVLLALDLPVDIVGLAPKLRWVQAIGAGVGQLIAVLKNSDIELVSAAGLNSSPIGEFVMARLLGVWRGLRELDDLQRSRRWSVSRAATTSVGGRTVCVIGAGGIGTEVARRAAAFDLNVVGVRRRPELGAPPCFNRVVGPDGLHSLLAESDAVVLAAPATTRTNRLIGASELAAMRPGAVLCNVARGSLVDEEALIESLRSGHLGAAILDVTDQEPLSRQSPLWSAPRMFLSPHIAGWWGPQYAARIGEFLKENVDRERQGLPLKNKVDFAEGY